MNPRCITLIAYGPFERKFLDHAAGTVRTLFRCPVELREQHLDTAGFYNAARRQYDGNGLLKHLDANYDSTCGKVIGIFDIDLFIPILTFIFGQACLGGRTGIASSYRLRNERYGLPLDESLLNERFIKEIIHELGHLHGLYHCHSPGCVMQSSTYVEDIDQKGTELCPSCLTAAGVHPGG